MAVTNKAAAFVLDDRSIEAQLEAFRQYCQCLPYGTHTDADSPWPSVTNWAQVFLGFEAGAWAALPGAWSTAGEVAWAFEQQRLANLYQVPEQADGQLAPERAFLLSLLGMLETPRALLNQLPALHRSLYYRQMLVLEAQKAQADQVAVCFTLADGEREQVLPAGRLLEAGHDSAGNALRYELVQALTVNAARVTDLRWIVSDPSIPGGKLARVVLDEAAEQRWPTEGVRMFGTSSVKPGEPSLTDADRVVENGRIIESPVLAVADGERTWTVTLNHDMPGQGGVCAALSMNETWVIVPCKWEQTRRKLTVTLSAGGGVPTAVTTLDGLLSTAPLLRLTSAGAEPVPGIGKLEVAVKGAVGVICTRDDGTVLSEGGFPFGDMADAGCGLSLMSPEWCRLGPKLTTVTITPVWVGLPAMPFPKWYGPDERQKKPDWLLVDADLNVTTDTQKGRSLQQLEQLGTTTLAGRVTNGKAISQQIVADTGYPSVFKRLLTDNHYFKVSASLMRQGHSLSALGDSLALFDGAEVPYGQALPITLSGVPAAVQGPDTAEPTRWPWYIRLSLSTSFLQNEYVAHERSPQQTVSFLTEHKTIQHVPVIDKAPGVGQMYGIYKMVESDNIGADGKKIRMPAMKEETVSLITPVTVTVPKAQWHPPYIPQWSGVRIDYQAVDDQVTQRNIMPFGYALHDTLETPAEAEVYLGVNGIEAGQLLTLYWQLKSPCALPLEWQYLTAGERWARLPVNDGTDGWRMSGMWSVDWPGDASRTSTSLPSGRMWLRGRVRKLPVRDMAMASLPTTPWLTGVVTNVAEARLVSPQLVQATHFDSGLAAGRITQMQDMPESLQSVEQPWPSTGGRAAETDTAFEARVGRRLRHRERGLNNVDLMMLLQEKYEGLRELAILASSPGNSGALRQTIVVMPGPTLSDSEDARRPGLSVQHLQEMALGLKTISSPWLELECVNPHYISVSVSWDVSYVPGVSRSIGNSRVKAALDAAFMSWTLSVNDRDSRVIGRTITHSAVRDVLRQVNGVEKINTIYLNGDPHKIPETGAGQVVVLTCIPLEYTGLTIAWKESGEHGCDELILEGGKAAIVQVTVPTSVLGLAHSLIDTAKADVYLMDLDTGRPLPKKVTSGARLWTEDITSMPAEGGAVQNTVPNENVADSGRVRYFKVHTLAGKAGVSRLGVALTLESHGVTLQSAEIGEYLVLQLHALTATA